MVYVNDLPSAVYGNNDHGLGLCHYIAPGSLTYTNQLQSPYKITNYDDNLNSTPKNEINFIQVDTTNQPNLEFSITGNEFDNEFFAVYCSTKKGVLGTQLKTSNSFGTWLSLNLPSTCTYVSFTPYTKVTGAPNLTTYCAHTAILVNIRDPCPNTKRTMLRA